MSGVRLDGKHAEVRTGPQTSVRLCRLPVHIERRQGQIYPRALADLNVKDLETFLQTHRSGPSAHVPKRFTACHRDKEASPPRLTP